MVKILIADDERTTRKIVETFLRKIGYETFTAEDGQKGLDIFYKEKPEIALVDIQMPVMDGVDMLKRIKERSKDTEVIITTGYADITTAIQTLKEGAFGYIQKPIDKDELEMEIRNALEKQTVKKIVKSQKEQLIQADKMASLGALAAGVVHEINNPLNVAIGDIHLFKRDINDLVDFINRLSGITPFSDTSKEMEKLKNDRDITYLIEHTNDKLSRCNEAMARIKEIVQGMKEFSHKDSGEIIRTDINKSIESSLQMIPKKYKRDIDIKTKFTPLPEISCYGRQIEQVFVNVIINALQEMKDGGMLKIKTSFDDDYLNVKFCDTGSGIPEDKIKQVFDPFYTTKPAGEGTGLGLSISYSIIEKHGGDITVANNVDKGATFTIKFPKNM